MLPHKDGLDICQTIKSDPSISNIIVIIVSAMDPTSNRFKGIKYGADYYIKKPFDPNELRSLVTIFLKKKGKRFDPLIDLPDESWHIERGGAVHKGGDQNVIGTIKIGELANTRKGSDSTPAMVILRLISQLLQDQGKGRHQTRYSSASWTATVFVIAGKKGSIDESVVEQLSDEFNAVLPFILQDEGYKSLKP